MESILDFDRKLASIQIVENIEKHPNADTLEFATILGWQIIIKKGDAQIGDKVIFCEIDSLLPVNATWLPIAIIERIRQKNIKNTFRIKTIKLRGELSQGLIIPFSDKLPDSIDWYNADIGTNVTDILNIGKYEPPLFETGSTYYSNNNLSIKDRKYNFPTHLVSRTNETRIQSVPSMLKTLTGQKYVITIKLDGTSSTYVYDDDKFLVCSRNFIRDYPENINNCPYWYIAIKYDLENKLKEFPHYAIQGEICGPNIQRNLLKLSTIDYFVFNVIDTRTKRKLPINDALNVCNILGLKHVPILEHGVNFNYQNIKDLLEKSKGYYENTKNHREGLVIRDSSQIISFKVINNDYLLKHDG